MLFISILWKRQAREALKNHWLTGLLIALVVNLPSLLVQGIAAMTGNDLNTRLTEILYGSVTASGTISDPEGMMAKVAALSQETGIWAMQGLNLAAWLLTPCLLIGMLHWMLLLLRKQPAGDVTAVFSRIHTFWKGIGLRLYVILRVFLWMLPGVALSLGALLPLWLSDTSSRIAVLSAANTSVGLQSAAMMATAALGIMAALKYALGDLVLADRPEMGPIQAAKESLRLTRGKRGVLFSLYVSFVFWYLLQFMLTSVALDLFGSVPAIMVEMLCSLAITVYMNTSIAGFYLTVKGGEPKEIQTEGEVF